MYIVENEQRCDKDLIFFFFFSIIDSSIIFDSVDYFMMIFRLLLASDSNFLLDVYFSGQTPLLVVYINITNNLVSKHL